MGALMSDLERRESGDTLTGLAMAENRIDLLVEDGDTPVEVAEQIEELSDGLPPHRGEFIAEISQDIGDQPAREFLVTHRIYAHSICRKPRSSTADAPGEEYSVHIIESTRQMSP
jgi:hypothetical protein